MRSALVVWLAACSYSPPGGASAPTDAVAVQEDAPADAPSDAPPDVVTVDACVVTPSGGATSAGFVGGNGGGTSTNLQCPTGQLPIGAEFELINTTSGTFNNQRVITALHVRCGTVSRTTSNTMVTVPTERLTREGICDDDTASGEQLCPAGAVFVGIRRPRSPRSISGRGRATSRTTSRSSPARRTPRSCGSAARRDARSIRSRSRVRR